jgi:hypothetical protein
LTLGPVLSFFGVAHGDNTLLELGPGNPAIEAGTACGLAFAACFWVWDPDEPCPAFRPAFANAAAWPVATTVTLPDRACSTPNVSKRDPDESPANWPLTTAVLGFKPDINAFISFDLGCQPGVGLGSQKQHGLFNDGGVEDAITT